MKHLYAVLVAVLFLTGFALQGQAQDNDPIEGGAPGRAYNQFIQGGISLGYWGYGYGLNRVGFTLPVSVSYERYFTEYVSGGAFIGYASYKYEDINNDGYRWTFLNFGPRVSYDYTHILNDVFELGVDAEQFDFYASLMLLLEARSFSTNVALYEDEHKDNFTIGLGGVLGVRYKFKDNLAVFGETGRGSFGYLTAGVSYYF